MTAPRRTIGTVVDADRDGRWIRIAPLRGGRSVYHGADGRRRVLVCSTAELELAGWTPDGVVVAEEEPWDPSYTVEGRPDPHAALVVVRPATPAEVVLERRAAKEPPTRRPDRSPPKAR